jgi:hypothetical protein
MIQGGSVMADVAQEAVISVTESALYQQALAVVVRGPREVTADMVDQIADVIRKLRDASDCSKYLQGGCLAKIFNEKLWRKKNPEMTFMEYVEDVIGIGYRKAMYLISIYDRATRLGCTAEQLDRVGWVKARNILQIATKEDVDDWLARAESQTNQEVERDVRMAKARQRDPVPEIIYDMGADVVEIGEPVTEPLSDTAQEPEVETQIVEPLENFSVRVTIDQRRTIQLAIEKIAAENSEPGTLMSRGNALDLMATEWLGNHLPREKALEWHVAQLCRVYGVDIEVLPVRRAAT